MLKVLFVGPEQGTEVQEKAEVPTTLKHMSYKLRCHGQRAKAVSKLKVKGKVFHIEGLV